MKVKASINTKINCLVICSLLLLGVVSVILSSYGLLKRGNEEVDGYRKAIMAEKKGMLTYLVAAAYTVAEHNYQESQDSEKLKKQYGDIVRSAVQQAYAVLEVSSADESLGDTEARQEYAKKIIEKMRFGQDGKGYFWINDLHPTLVMHPFKPEDAGKDMSDYDLDGKKVYKEFVKAAKDGTGFVEYSTRKYSSGEEQLQKKLSYVKLFEPWGWVIGAGIYLESTEADLKAKTLNTINSLRYGKDGKDYFYTVDTVTRTMLQHPKESLIGKPDTFFKDPDGKQQVVAQINIARDQGEGFDEYKWAKLGEEKPQPKLTFIKAFKPWNMAIATGVYTDDVDKAIELKRKEINAAIRSQIYWQGGVILGLILLSIVLAYPVVSVGIVKPIRTMIAMLKDIAEGEGDLTKRIVDNSGDETEEMANWFNQFIGKVQHIIKDVTDNAATLYSSSQTLTGVSRQMSTNAAHTSDTAGSVAAASEEMSANMHSVAAAMEEASTNVSMVAAATEEMSSTINEIAENTEKARDITASAVTRTVSASSQVGELGRAAREIGKVVETITEISSQVDLLALNATIEAARAGDAGKGFAVVAGEIKELARQTAEASGEIKQRVEGIQSNTEGTVSEINDVSQVVNEINTIVATIATAVEEQSATTREIVSNVSQASVGLSEVNENVAQSSQVSSEIAREISDVTGSANDISASCSEVNSSSEQLAALAEKLNQMVKQFKV